MCVCVCVFVCVSVLLILLNDGYFVSVKQLNQSAVRSPVAVADKMTNTVLLGLTIVLLWVGCAGHDDDTVQQIQQLAESKSSL